jgi:hypothetical protein
MDLYRAIQDLHAEKEKLERVIASLEELQRKADTLAAAGPVKGRRGRKFMSESEREEVSLRMKRYWDERRRARQTGLQYGTAAVAGGDATAIA